MTDILPNPFNLPENISIPDACKSYQNAGYNIGYVEGKKNTLVKVREAIEKHRDDCDCQDADYKCSWCDLIEELGLKGEQK